MASSSDKGKGSLDELVGPRSGTFLPLEMPSTEELDSFVPQVMHCRSGVPACYTADEFKIRTKGEMG